MNFIYKLFERSLETYFIEIEFYSPKSKKIDEYNKKYGTEFGGDFKLYLPIFVQVNNISQAQSIMKRIVDTLRDEYNIDHFLLSRIDKTPISEKRFMQILERLNKTYKYSETADLSIYSYTPDEYGHYNHESPKITNIDIRVKAIGTVSWTKQYDYTVMISITTSEE